MPSVPIDRLRLPNDETEIPRLREEPYLVSEYAAVMRLYDGWGDFPPVICDQEFLVLDGVHRTLAAIEVGISKVPYKTMECADAAERLLAAASFNSQHGKRWTSKDITKVTLFAERIGVSSDVLAQAMRVRVERIERVPVGSVLRRKNGEEVEERIYIKRAVRFAMRDRVLTESQEAMMESLTTPNLADALLLDLIRIAALDALPQLNVDSYKNVLAVQALLDGWVRRDEHLLGAE